MSVLTAVERMILINQLTILERVDPHEAEYYGNSRKAIENAFELEIEGYVRPRDTALSSTDCREVMNIFDMYSSIQRCYDALDDRSGIDESEIPGKGPRLRQEISADEFFL